MPHLESLIPRPVLFNAALYGISALIYTVTLFVLETLRPGKYVFDPDSNWRIRFSYLAISSWPVLLFGALTLIAVRIGAHSRRRLSKKSRAKRKAKKAAAAAAARKPEPPAPSTTPPAEPGPAQPPTTAPPLPSDDPRPSRGSDAAREPVKKKSSKRPKVPRGYVSVTRAQKIFAAFGFLWVAVGLACTAACGALVFFGQRERYRYTANITGNREDSWKTWVIPLVTGGLPAVVYGVMALTTLLKFFSTIMARGREVNTPVPSVGNEDLEVGGEDGPLEVDVLFEHPEGYPAAPAPIGMVRTGGLDDRDLHATYRPEDGYAALFAYQPDNRTIERMMRQLRDMGYNNPSQNIAALQASSFDLELASEKLANAQR